MTQRFWVRLLPLLPPLELNLGVAPLDIALGVAPLGLAPLGLGLDLTLGVRRNKQNRETEETVINPGSTYLILFVRLNNVLIRLGRFLTHSIAINLVSGLYDLTIPLLTSKDIFTSALALSVSRYALNETKQSLLFNKSER
jgi:hypothetical protein